LEIPKTQWHGYTDLRSFLKASLALGTVLVSGVSAVMVWGVSELDARYDERYAPAAIVKIVEENGVVQRQMQELMLAEWIFTQRVRQCDATSTEARQQAARRLAELRRDYRIATGADGYLPECADVR